MPLRRDSFKFISSKLSTISFQLLSMTPSGSIPSGPPWSLWENNASVSDGPVTDRPSRCSGTVPAGRPDALPEPSAHRTNVPRPPPPFPGAPAGGGGEMAAAAQCELRRSAGRQCGRGGWGGGRGAGGAGAAGRAALPPPVRVSKSRESSTPGIAQIGHRGRRGRKAPAQRLEAAPQPRAADMAASSAGPQSRGPRREREKSVEKNKKGNKYP